MSGLLQYLKDMLYAITALAKAFERIADCLEYFVEQDKRDTKRRDEALAKIVGAMKSPFDGPSFASKLFDSPLWKQQ